MILTKKTNTQTKGRKGVKDSNIINTENKFGAKKKIPIHEDKLVSSEKETPRNGVKEDDDFNCSVGSTKKTGIMKRIGKRKALKQQISNGNLIKTSKLPKSEESRGRPRQRKFPHKSGSNDIAEPISLVAQVPLSMPPSSLPPAPPRTISNIDLDPTKEVSLLAQNENLLSSKSASDLESQSSGYSTVLEDAGLSLSDLESLRISQLSTSTQEGTNCNGGNDEFMNTSQHKLFLQKMFSFYSDSSLNDKEKKINHKNNIFNKNYIRKMKNPESNNNNRNKKNLLNKNSKQTNTFQNTNGALIV
ncbi:hypothetical protein PACTADRAFT_3420 [Pachysolen tannophilus NRRL Y-2460]|uniref:Uncharacterized protein n=1 Tax=Pachysolen tannophilus NRRL Y-2460 TaxID=669874 RepID=A0A1E4TS29_PACTA|nr:hypothetical protein PACTADRAFT_3420 [Pachysolen tannophilus NRRL Y-2460]